MELDANLRGNAHHTHHQFNARLTRKEVNAFGLTNLNNNIAQI